MCSFTSPDARVGDAAASTGRSGRPPSHVIAARTAGSSISANAMR